MEETKNCAYDSLSLYDGSAEDSGVILKICAEYNDSVTSTGSTLLVVFKSDDSINAGRFSLQWTFVEQGGDGHGEHRFIRDFILQCFINIDRITQSVCLGVNQSVISQVIESSMDKTK